MNRRRLIRAVPILITAGLSLGLFASTQRVSAMTEREDAADNLFQPAGRLAPTAQADTITIECPMEAQIGIVDLPQGWSPGLYPRYPFKFINISTGTGKVNILCSYGPKQIEGGWTMLRTLPASYSYQVPNIGNSYVVCKLKPLKPRREKKQ